MGSLLEAAGRLQVGVFASGPLQEAALLQHSALQVSYANVLQTVLSPACLRHSRCHNHACASSSLSDVGMVYLLVCMSHRTEHDIPNEPFWGDYCLYAREDQCSTVAQASCTTGASADLAQTALANSVSLTVITFVCDLAVPAAEQARYYT